MSGEELLHTNLDLEKFSRLTELGDKTDFLVQDPDLGGMSLEQFSSLPAEEIARKLESVTPAQQLEKLKILGYWVAFRQIQKDRELSEVTKKEELMRAQERIDATALEWIEHLASTESGSEATKAWANDQLKVINFDLEHRGKKYTNLQILRGSKCNVSCPFCFTQRAEKEMGVDTKSHLASVAEVNYNRGEVFSQMMYARMAFGLNEALFTSYGDPLANIRTGEVGKEANPFVSLAEEVQMAKEAGFPQVTILTNGTGFYENNASGLSEDEKEKLGIDDSVDVLTDEQIDRLGQLRIDSLVESGLTNLTISLHTMNPETWQRMLKPRLGVGYEQMIKWVKYAGEKKGLTLRLNIAYSTEVENYDELIPWANSLGIQELTMVEMIPGNEYAKTHHKEPPSAEEMEAIGYKPVGGHSWGLTIFRNPDSKLSVAVCYFGQQDPSFQDQEKNLELILSGAARSQKGSMLVAGGLWDKTTLEWWKPKLDVIN